MNTPGHRGVSQVKKVGPDVAMKFHYITFADFTSSGIDFQKVGAVTGKDLDLIFVLNLGIKKNTMGI